MRVWNRQGPSVHTQQTTSVLNEEKSKAPARSENKNLGHHSLLQSKSANDHALFAGVEVLVDALLLSRAQHMVHSQSNVASAVAYMNPFIVSHYIGEKEVPSDRLYGRNFVFHVLTVPYPKSLPSVGLRLSSWCSFRSSRLSHI